MNSADTLWKACVYICVFLDNTNFFLFWSHSCLLQHEVKQSYTMICYDAEISVCTCWIAHNSLRNIDALTVIVLFI